jgi:hypothetical protein
MSVRDQILGAAKNAGFPQETVTVPEWDDAKIVVRGLSVGDKRRLFARTRRFEEAPGGKWVVVPVDDPLSDLYLVYLAAHDENGARIFEESDIEELAEGGDGTEAAVTRLADIARNLSGMGAAPEEAVTDEATVAGKASPTPTGEQPSSSATT